MSNTSSTLDIITILIASIALIISIVTVIRQFFYKKFSFDSCLIFHESTEGSFSPFNFEYSVANTGNVVLILREIIIEPINPPKPATTLNIETNNIPMILKPEQLEMVKFNIPRKLLPKNTLKEFKLKVSFIIISPKGDMFSVPHHLNFNDRKELMDEGWKPFRLNTRRHEIKV